MNQFDIEAYTKRTLGDYAVPPHEDSWLVISKKLDHLRYRKEKRMVGIKIVMVIASFLYVPIYTVQPDYAREIIIPEDTN